MATQKFYANETLPLQIGGGTFTRNVTITVDGAILSAATAGVLNCTLYDVDTTDELAIEINSNSYGFATVTGNETSGPTQKTITLAHLSGGSNTITFDGEVKRWGSRIEGVNIELTYPDTPIGETGVQAYEVFYLAPVSKWFDCRLRLVSTGSDAPDPSTAGYTVTKLITNETGYDIYIEFKARA
jgi:hypothetical protein